MSVTYDVIKFKGALWSCCKHTEVKFTFSVINHNVICVPLRSTNLCECISVLIKHLQILFLNEFITNIVYIHVN